MFSTTKSIRGNKCAQVFTNGIGYDFFYPLKKEADTADALNNVIQLVGIPMELVSDGAKANTQGRFGTVLKEFHVKQQTTEAYSAWQNRAEASVHGLKHGIMRATLLWGFSASICYQSKDRWTPSQVTSYGPLSKPLNWNWDWGNRCSKIIISSLATFPLPVGSLMYGNS
jgi:hypothetical protein